MKSKVYIVFLVCLFSISFSACSTNNNNLATHSVSPTSSQITDASASDSVTAPEGENSLPADTYQAVMQNEVAFINTDDNQEFFLNDFLNRNSEYAGIYKVTHFAVLDMDGDQTPEVVLELSLHDYPEQYEVLHYSNGTVYGYNFVYRGLEMLKADGSYIYANSSADVGVVKILSFKSDSVETETLGYAQTDYSGGNTEISYFIQNTSVTQKAFNAFLDQQNEKKDAQWYEFSVENIEAKICMDLNADPLSEATDRQIQLIVDHISLWQGDSSTELYGYAVTDLNQNGRLEIISFSCQGTGIYTYSNIWEVTETFDGLVLLETSIDEYTSQADIMVDTVPVYYNPANNLYHYIFDDLTKNGAAEYYENKRAICIQNGQLVEQFLAYKTTIYQDSAPTVTYTDVNGNPINEGDYSHIGDNVFSDLEKKQASFKWLINENAEWSALKDDDVKNMLEQSFQAFSIS